MSQSDVKNLDQKLNSLYEYIFSEKSSRQLGNEIDIAMNRREMDIPFTVFLSLCDTKERAHVCHGMGDSLEEAWKNAVASSQDYVLKNNLQAIWVKVDIVCKAELINIQKAANIMFAGLNEFFRRGISLDKEFRYSFTEAELNGNRLLAYKTKCIDLRTINKYLMERDDDIIMAMPKDVYFFDCKQYFIDEKNEMYTLYTEGLNCGRRIIDDLSKKYIMHIVNTGVRYLVNQIHKDGTFDYGYYPVFHKLIPKYNILRHTSTIWSMICVAEINKDRNIFRSSLTAIKYMTDQIAHYDEGYAYLVESTSNEIKLGGNAVAVILLTQYMKLYETDEFCDLCVELGEGILRMLNLETGSYTHVLSYPSLEVKDEYRTVYYDGEATFALARLYSLTKDEKWLKAAQKAVDHFIDANYIQFRDHWVAYAVNELTMYIPEERYFEFGLKNAQMNLRRIYNQETSYHTYLELLTATFQMYKRILDEGHKVAYLEKFDEVAFIEAIFHRGYHMLNGYGYPEYVMYFKKPSYFLGSFNVRHDGYRTRIDDVQHFCGAYISVYKQYEDLCARYKELTGLEKFEEKYEPFKPKK